MRTRIVACVLFTLALPGVTLAAAHNFLELSNTLVELISTATGVLIVFGLVAYFYGMATNINEFGKEDGHEKIKAYFFWGIVILFVMVSIWGIVELLRNTIFSDSAFHPTDGSPVSVCDRFGDCS